MFGFEMMFNYEERKVTRYEQDNLIIDTCAITDSDQPYETAVAHPSYNDGNFIIVELYKTKEEAQIGHDKWVKIMTSENLPTVLKDESSSEIKKFACSITDIETIFEKK